MDKQNQEGGSPVSVRKLDELVQYQDGAVVSNTLLKKNTGTVTLFAFDEGEELSEHTAPFDALVFVVQGRVEISIAGTPYHLETGETILLPADQPHAVKAVSKFKMLLTMIRA